MSITLGGTNPAVTFPDGTIQNTAGAVLQVVNGIYATQTSTASSTFTNTGLSLAITPKFSTSKILVLIDHAGTGKDTSATSVSMKLLRNGSQILFMENIAGATGTTNQNFIGAASCNYLDSPATTSATTYSTQFCSQNNSGFAYVQGSGATSTITLMEIAG